MNIRESYDTIGADFEDVLGRLGSESLIQRFALKFIDDGSYNELTEALTEKNAEKAFRAAHTLKGICLNLGFRYIQYNEAYYIYKYKCKYKSNCTWSSFISNYLTT